MISFARLLFDATRKRMGPGPGDPAVTAETEVINDLDRVEGNKLEV